MKKNLSLIFLLFFVFFIKSTFVFANDDDLKSHANFNLGTTKLPDGRSFIARNPFDPKLPFPANSIYKESHSSLFGTILVDGQNHWGQVEFDLEGQSEATTQYPKLYSWREYLLNPSDEASDYNENWEQKTGIKNAGLVHVPVRWGFEQIYSDDSKIILQAVGESSVYTNDFSHLQLFDNRLGETESGWKVGVKLVDWPVSKSGDKLVGSYIKIPKAMGRNELNNHSSEVDNKFETNAVEVQATNWSILWETKSANQLKEEGFSPQEIVNVGKGMSSLTWQTKDVTLHVPKIAQMQAGEYFFELEWILSNGPNK